MNDSDPAELHISTRRWLLVAAALTLLGIVGAFASVLLRRTRLEQTREFWGPEVIRSLQLSDEFWLTIPPEGPLRWKRAAAEEGVDLSDTPGIAHLRHALLDERHYLWETARHEPIAAVIERIPDAEWVTITLRGSPTNLPEAPKIETVELRLELSQGWVGVVGSGKSVRLQERVRTAVRHSLLTFSNVTSKRVDAS